MIDKLLQIFSNYTRSIEILYLLNNIRRLVRLDANEIELKKIKEFCNKENLYLEISNFKVIKLVDEGKGNYSNIVKKVSSKFFGSQKIGLHHIYISKDKTRARLLKFLESKDDDKAIGKLLGYPECCINFFVENKKVQQKVQNDYILPALANSEGFEFPFYTNYTVRYFDVALLSHFPHSFNCKDSIKIAKTNFEFIRKFPQLASKFEEMLKSPVLYTENKGIFVFKNYKLDNNRLEFEEVKSTTNNELSNLLNKNKKIEIINKNKIKIEDKIIENIGFMLFG